MLLVASDGSAHASSQCGFLTGDSCLSRRTQTSLRLPATGTSTVMARGRSAAPEVRLNVSRGASPGPAASATTACARCWPPTTPDHTADKPHLYRPMTALSGVEPNWVMINLAWRRRLHVGHHQASTRWIRDPSVEPAARGSQTRWSRIPGPESSVACAPPLTMR